MGVTGWMPVSAASDISLPVESGFTDCVPECEVGWRVGARVRDGTKRLNKDVERAIL